MTAELPSLRRSVADVPEQPWKNGRGVARELAQGPGWRISLANVDKSGDFSIFPGWTRHSVVVAGEGLLLRSGTAQMDLRLDLPATYDGGLLWHATLLDGPVRVLNVMVEEKVARAEIHVYTGDARTVAPTGRWLFVLSLDGSVEAGQFFVSEAGPALTFSAPKGMGARLFVAHIRQHPS